MSDFSIIIMSKLIILTLSLVLIIVISGCTSESTSEEIQPSQKTTGQAKNITILYSATEEDVVFSESGYSSEPDSGKIFLVVNMTIKNNGYDKFSTNPFYFSAIANNVKYDIDSSTYSIEDSLDSVDILDGGTLNGILVFQLPQSTSSGYVLSYESFTTYNIIWNKV
jgi:hypothetical protein